MKNITVFNTHIEIYPYKKGENFQLEKSLSKWNVTTHHYIPIAYYVQDNTLYLPRGINLSVLQSTFNSIPSIHKNSDLYNYMKSKIEILANPRDRIQEESIDFLTSNGRFAIGKSQTQFGLNLDTGDGKTYCMCNAIVTMHIKTIIITHKDRIKNQWITTLNKMFEFNEPNRIYSINGYDDMEKIMNGHIEADIYIVNHQTIASYARVNGWNSIKDFFNILKVGVKVFDESHKFFNNSLMIDYFSNTARTFYLTATFSRSDIREAAIYRLAYSSVYRFGEETFNYEEKRKHIVFVVIYYHSNPTLLDVKNMITANGFSSYKFIDYALNEEDNMLMKVINYVLKATSHLEGSTLIVSPKIESTEYIAKSIKMITNKSVGTVHSKNSNEENNENIHKDIICSTVKSIGEGDDIKKLRIIINAEPIGSRSLADQLRGRLREFSENDDTFMFYPVDTSIKETVIFLKRIMPVMKKKCKEIIITNFSDYQ